MRANTCLKKVAILGIFFNAFLSCANLQDDLTAVAETVDTVIHEIPLAGNAFLTHKPDGADEIITSSGLANWTNNASTTSVYFRSQDAGNVSLKLRAKVAPESNSSKIKITVGGSSKEINLTGSNFQDYEIGSCRDHGLCKIGSARRFKNRGLLR
ncbi:DUF5077 domain-containing protein [Sphingobacterium deserti]|uniref:Nematoblast specific protein n=1 Tax=Sphingobacterium deserti TaxID=1229276 RepID=A0A0B8T2P3_9SPHI|nr:DUF5077 domain-containing protein [Sphingobacterium deserti]KGE15627.1 nematoblast specific protein [Sphingobacterium deserti]